jgi:hypothetical protein
MASDMDVTFGFIDAGGRGISPFPGVGVADIFGSSPTRGTVPLPAAFAWASSGALMHEVARRHRERPFDAAIAVQPHCFPYIAGLDGCLLVLDAQNVESRLFEQFACFDEKRQDLVRRLAGPFGIAWEDPGASAAEIRQFETAAWRAADLVLAVSETEARIIGEHASRCALVRNCGERSARLPLAELDCAPAIAFVGAMDYVPNVDALAVLGDEILPIVHRTKPRTATIAWGLGPSPDLVAWSSRRGINVRADAPSVWPHVRTSVLAVPLRVGAGTRIKVLDAVANGVSVVASSLAVEGLGLQHGGLVSVCDEPELAAQALLSAMERQEGRLQEPIGTRTWESEFASLPALLRMLSGVH